MSVLVRNMEMPKNCAECRFCVNGFTDDAPIVQTFQNVRKHTGINQLEKNAQNVIIC